jgi:putative membrane protein
MEEPMQVRTRIAISAAAAAILGFAVASLLRAQGPAAAPALDDATIVAIFDAANTADIETAGLAVSRASHKDVRELARTFVHDHTGVRQQGRDLAKKLGVTPTPPKDDTSARDHAAAMQKLEALSGPEFDRAFLAHEVAFHKAVLDAVQKTLVPAIKNAELKAFVLKVAPAFQGHLAAAENLAEKYGAQASTAPPAAQTGR